MLTTLIGELAELPAVQLTVLQDWRCAPQLALPANARVVLVAKDQVLMPLLAKLIAKADAVWPIAPETDAILTNLSQLVADQAKVLLNSAAQAVALCSDKLHTAQQLQRHAIAVVDSAQLTSFTPSFAPPWVVKPKTGVGCVDSYFITTWEQLARLKTQLKQPSTYIIQPYISGDSLSLSCLFRGGEAWLLCCNRQQLAIKHGRFVLLACVVNIATKRGDSYQRLAATVAKAVSGLWGYVGIDIMQADTAPAMVLEINPRLTTSYVGIQQALGINVANLVLAMVAQPPLINPTLNQQITVPITDHA